MKAGADGDSWSASRYVANNSLQRRHGIRAIDAVDWGGVRSALDIGCGDGFLTRRIRDRLDKDAAATPSVVGIDASQSMIAYAKATATSIPSLEYRCLDVLEMDYNNDFDFITSFYAWHFVSDISKGWRRVAQALHPRGRTYFHFGTKIELAPIILDGIAEESGIKCTRWLPPGAEENQAAAVEVGLEVISARTIVTDCSFESDEDLWGFFYATHPACQQLGSDDEVLWKNQFLERYYAQCAPELASIKGFRLTRTEIETTKP